MSKSATDFSCDDPSYDNTDEQKEQTPKAKTQTFRATVGGTPAPKPDTEQQTTDSD